MSRAVLIRELRREVAILEAELARLDTLLRAFRIVLAWYEAHEHAESETTAAVDLATELVIAPPAADDPATTVRGIIAQVHVAEGR